MGASDVTQTLDEAIALTGVDQVPVKHRPRLLSDNGSAYLSNELRDSLGQRHMTHTRGAPYHPQTQGKIERYHRTLKKVVKLQHYDFPWELEALLQDFVAYYNNERYHEALDNVTPADAYFGRKYAVVSEREKIKKRTMRERKKEYLAAKAAGEATPRALPVQILDYASGFLMAFAGQVALLRQQEEGGSWHVQVSLAVTAHWLRSLGRIDFRDKPASLGLRNHAVTTASGFGKSTAMPHTARIDGIEPGSERPSVRPGTHAATWPPTKVGPLS